MAGRATVRAVIGKCVECQVATKPLVQQKMAPLPIARLGERLPWVDVGVDFAGPFGDVAAGGNKRSLGAKAPEIALRYIFLYPPSLYTRRRPDQTSGLEMHRPRFSKESSLAVARQSPSSA
jgi:hypothetical protein